MMKRVTRQTPGQQLTNEGFELTSSLQRTPPRSPSRSRMTRSQSAIVTPKRRNLFENQENNAMDIDDKPSPPKTRKTENNQPIFSIDSPKTSPNINLLNQRLNDSIMIDDDENSRSSTGDLTHRITRMIVSQSGARKRKKNKNDVSDEEMEDEPEGLFVQPEMKRSASDLDYNRIKMLLDEMDKKQEKNLTKMINLDDIYEEWNQLLELTEYNILVTGKGSKMTVINNYLKNSPMENCVVIQGTSSTTTSKTILKEIESLLNIKLPTKRERSALHYAMDLGYAVSQQNVEVLLVIHNLDGSNLRDSNQQCIIATFVDACHDKLRLLASVDHINSGLLWNDDIKCLYAFIPYTVDTYMTYKKEIEDDAPGLLGMEVKSAAQSHTLSSLEVFWQALPSNAQKELALLVFLSTSNIEGIVDMNTLFDEARQRMITNSKASLKQHLTEFKDHHLITMNQDIIKLIADKNMLLKFMENKGIDL